ncbi:hypothetical protein CVT25_005218 [Psilocybe cyanescens]|uniref:Uncharacterized protein n=1 Tax=Psilocybe cyanescens TaxID=93625 RepID=A0A409WX66_PSICY|nr:hypothetical protein CVT25_005218 [Psilocybe cyanescens]
MENYEQNHAQMPSRSSQIVYNTIILGDAHFYGFNAPQTTHHAHFYGRNAPQTTHHAHFDGCNAPQIAHRMTLASTPHSQGQSFSSRAGNTRGDQPTSGVQTEDVYDQYKEHTAHVDTATVPSLSSGIDAYRNPSTDTTPSSPFVRTERTGNSPSVRPSMSHATTQTPESLDSKGRGDNTPGFEPAIAADTAHSTSPVGFPRPPSYMIAPPSEFIDHDWKLVPGPVSRLSQLPSPSDDNTACVHVRNEDEVDTAGEDNLDRRRRKRPLWKRVFSKLGALFR